MKIEVTWNKPDGTKPTVGFENKAGDPHAKDEEMQLAKALAAAQAHFHEKFGEAPKLDQFSYRVVQS
jgi:hypothetical protein